MNYQYLIKAAKELRDPEISTILNYWGIEEWKHFDPGTFKEKFKESEFHLLCSDHSDLLSVGRINFKFSINLDGESWPFAELVGLVSIVKQKGFARKLLKEIQGNLHSRQIQSIGFSATDLREFYRKWGIGILPGKAKDLFEKSGDNLIESEDDDILLINVNGNHLAALNMLSPEAPGLLDFS